MPRDPVVAQYNAFMAATDGYFHDLFGPKHQYPEQGVTWGQGIMTGVLYAFTYPHLAKRMLGTLRRSGDVVTSLQTGNIDLLAERLSRTIPEEPRDFVRTLKRLKAGYVGEEATEQRIPVYDEAAGLKWVDPAAGEFYTGSKGGNGI